MRFEEQGTVGSQRYTVVPRTLCFLTCEDRLLLLRGAPNKRIWANRLNGLGGHVEPGEDPYAAALREIREEAGLTPERLALRGIVHVSGRQGHPGVILFVFVGQAPSCALHASQEGALEWHPLSALPWAEMVEDLPHLLPRVLDGFTAPIFAHYESTADGEMVFYFRETQAKEETP